MKKGVLLVKAFIIILVLMLAFTGCVVSEGEGGTKNTAGTSGKVIENLNLTGLPIVNEKVTLTVGGPKSNDMADFETMWFWQRAEEKTNVHIDWQMSPEEGWKEKISLIFFANDLPDIMMGGALFNTMADKITEYGTQELIVPLDNLIKEYAPRINEIFEQRPDYVKSITVPDGHVYTIPNIMEDKNISGQVMMINKYWLGKVGLDIPKTTDEFYNVLKAFKGKDLNENNKDDEIPFTFCYNQGDFRTLLGSWGIMENGNHIIVKDGEVIFSAIQEEYKEAIKYFHKLFAEGLADEESLTQARKIANAKIRRPARNEQIVGVFQGWSLKTHFGNIDLSDFDYVMPLTGPKGDQAAFLLNPQTSGMIRKGGFCITKANKNPEISIRWADYLHDEWVSWESYYGQENKHWKKEDGKLVMLDLPEGVKEAQWYSTDNPRNFSFTILMDFYNRQNVQAGDLKLEKDHLDAVYGEYRSKTFTTYPDALFDSDEINVAATIGVDINNYVNQTVANWLLNGGVDEGWDEYVKRLVEKMELETLMESYRQAYARYNKGTK